MLLRGKAPGLVTTWAVVCSSYSIVNVATSMRSLLTPLGNVYNTKVIRGNRMVARTVLVFLSVFCVSVCL